MNHIGKILLCLAVPMGSVVGTTMFSSCSDQWDDHYKTVTLGDGTLWEAMSKNSDLSNFQAVLKACGYESTLDGSQVFTIFAPVNSSFTEAMRDSVINLYNTQRQKGVKDSRNAAVKEFIMNHVALYNYSVSSLTNDSIVMMNGKYTELTDDSFEGGDFLDKNILTSNGILYKVSKLATYQPNIYEYIGRDVDLDSLASYIYSYSIDEFIASQSVPGEIKNGKTTYLDSVTELTNKLMTDWLDANLDNEDSLYWLLAPNNEVWDSLLTEYQNYFQFDAKVPLRDSLMFNFPRRAIVDGTAFSRIRNTDKSINDSVLSTNAVEFYYRQSRWTSYEDRYFQYDRPFEPGGVFDQTSDVNCSNGVVKKVDHWNIKKTETFMRKIVMEGESDKTFDSVYTVSTKDPLYYNMGTLNKFYNKVSRHRFIIIEPTSTSNIKVLFDVRDVLANVPYDVYVVTVPNLATDSLAPGLPTDFRAQLFYHDMTGKEVNFPVTGKFTTSGTDVDTIYVGQYTFPTCSSGLDEAQVKMLIEGRTSASAVRNGTATKSLYMDCIIFKPHMELEEE